MKVPDAVSDVILLLESRVSRVCASVRINSVTMLCRCCQRQELWYERALSPRDLVTDECELDLNEAFSKKWKGSYTLEKPAYPYPD